jgi:hypothetical protein
MHMEALGITSNIPLENLGQTNGICYRCLCSGLRIYALQCATVHQQEVDVKELKWDECPDGEISIPAQILFLDDDFYE